MIYYVFIGALRVALGLGIFVAVLYALALYEDRVGFPRLPKIPNTARQIGHCLVLAFSWAFCLTMAFMFLYVLGGGPKL